MANLRSKTVLIVGLGLIGGSIARGLRAVHPEQRILAYDLDAGALEAAAIEGVAANAGSLEDMLKISDLVILALPPLLTARTIRDLPGRTKPYSVVTDVASVKSNVVLEVNKQTADFSTRFVPGHPIAGSEKSGYAAADGELFRGRRVILTPQPSTRPSAVNLVNELWRSLGAEVLGMSVQRHDEVLAATSHLPHLLAFSVVDTLVQQEQSEDIFRYAAGGFADFSRLASSSARMWSEIFLANAAATGRILDAYIADLQAMREVLQRGDRDTMMSKFSLAKRSRDRFIRQYFSSNSVVEEERDTMDFQVEPGGSVTGRVRVPGDKSISHRAVMLGAIADGVTTISGFLEGEDALKTVAACREMGVTIVGPEQGQLTVYGVGKEGLQPPRKPLDMGNSGTAMRLLAGLLAAQDFTSELIGDASLTRRPMGRIADPLRLMGARLETSPDGTPPLRLTGRPLTGIEYTLPIASAQVKSCLLLAGLYARGRTLITEPGTSRDHTERMLEGFGYALERDPEQRTVAVTADHRLKATSIDVPADISSAAFFLVAASICPGADLTLEHVGVNPTRIGVINLLRAMGANISLHNERVVGGEPVADLRVQAAELRGIEIPADQIPLAIDEFPVLFIAAACAKGETVLRGAEELRVKESDRIAAMATGLETLDIEVETFADGIRIVGGTLGAGEIDSLGDHRIAMAFVVAGLRAGGPLLIKDCANVATSFPGFAELANQVGMRVHTEKAD